MPDLTVGNGCVDQCAHVSVPLFSMLDALIRVVLERNRKKEG